MIGIIDYGVGNLKNVSGALDRLNVDNIITDDISKLEKCEKLILPGVGAFKEGMNGLKERGLDKFLKSWVLSGKYILGICLGMQLLFDRSYEMGECDGLKFIKGEVVKFSSDMNLKIPHMGWNNLEKNHDDEILNELFKSGKDYVYFVHSFYASDLKDENLIAYANYGVKVPAIVRNKNVMGMQFHPEKSDKVGMRLLINYLELK